MNNSFIIFSEKDWEKSTADRRSWLIYNTLHSLDSRMKIVEQQIKKNLLFEKVNSFLGGVIGGALVTGAYLGFKLIKIM